MKRVANLLVVWQRFLQSSSRWVPNLFKRRYRAQMHDSVSKHQLGVVAGGRWVGGRGRRGMPLLGDHVCVWLFSVLMQQNTQCGTTVASHRMSQYRRTIVYALFLHFLFARSVRLCGIMQQGRQRHDLWDMACSQYEIGARATMWFLEKHPSLATPSAQHLANWQWFRIRLTQHAYSLA